MINIKSDWELDIMRTCAHVTGEILRDLAGYIEPGMSTLDINQFVENRIRKVNMTPSFLGLYDFPASACISVNEEVVHGIPRADRILKEGDIVSVDTGATYKGYVSDAARTYPVGEVSQVAKDLMAAAEKLGISCRNMPSGAGHDAMAFAPLFPTGMVFIPCEKGISHNPLESTTLASILDGADVLWAFLISEN